MDNFIIIYLTDLEFYIFSLIKVSSSFPNYVLMTIYTKKQRLHKDLFHEKLSFYSGHSNAFGKIFLEEKEKSQYRYRQKGRTSR